MTRIRIVKGNYEKIIGGNFTMSAEESIVLTAGGEITQVGVKNGVSFNNFKRVGSTINEDFRITFSLNKSKHYKNVVPFGILDFQGNVGNPFFAFNYGLSLSNIDDLQFQIFDSEGNEIYEMNYMREVVVSARRELKLQVQLEQEKPDYDPENFTNSWNWEAILEAYRETKSDFTKIGTYIIFWDGFDNNGIYDSRNFNNKRLTAKLTASKNGVSKSEELSFSTAYAEVKWVDVRIDKNNKKIDAILRVNLKDAGESGIKCKESLVYAPVKDFKIKTEWPWDKIPPSDIKPNKPIIKARTKTFAELEQLALEGLNYHWGRNRNHAEAKDVKINEEAYEVFVHAQNTEENTMDDIDLLYNTNGLWRRSNNPGCVSSGISFLANAGQYIPYVPLNETIFYNVGYVNKVEKYEADFLWEKDWDYIDDRVLYEGKVSKVDADFSQTCAHEIGHTILKAYAEKGGGSTDYSYMHKGSSDYSDTMPVSKGGVNYLREGEMDLMKYYNNRPKLLDFDFKRFIAEDRDVLGLFWLSKIEIK